MAILRGLAIVLLLLIPSPSTPSGGQDNRMQKIELERIGEPWGCRDSQAAIPPLAVSPDRLLVTVCDALYMLDASGQVLWKWTASVAFTDQPIVDSTGTIYAIGESLLWVALDAETGAEKWRTTACGRADYSQIKSYPNDRYLLLVDMSRYRDPSFPSPGINDHLFLCKGTEVLQEMAFPPSARLEVWGERILAVTHKETGVEITEILLPERGQ